MATAVVSLSAPVVRGPVGRGTRTICVAVGTAETGSVLLKYVLNNLFDPSCDQLVLIKVLKRRSRSPFASSGAVAGVVRRCKFPFPPDCQWVDPALAHELGAASGVHISRRVRVPIITHVHISRSSTHATAVREAVMVELLPRVGESIAKTISGFANTRPPDLMVVGAESRKRRNPVKVWYHKMFCSVTAELCASPPTTVPIAFIRTSVAKRRLDEDAFGAFLRGEKTVGLPPRRHPTVLICVDGNSLLDQVDRTDERRRIVVRCRGLLIGRQTSGARKHVSKWNLMEDAGVITRCMEALRSTEYDDDPMVHMLDPCKDTCESLLSFVNAFHDERVEALVFVGGGKQAPEHEPMTKLSNNAIRLASCPVIVVPAQICIGFGQANQAVVASSVVMKPPQIVVHDTIAVMQPTTADRTPSAAAADDREVVPEGGSSTVAVLGEGDDEAHEAEQTAAAQEDPTMARLSCGTAAEEPQQVLQQRQEDNLPAVVVHASAE